ncbi:MAG: hypothetical protein H0X42_01805 [Solirubrobacterales bacterium]|nr:hypothetical protein [Solirubrobacterales bacterium]
MSPRLSPLPDRFAATVASLHRVAAVLVAPERKPANEIALAATPGGFGTPEFEFAGARQRVRVEAAELVREVDCQERRASLQALAEAGDLIADLLPAGAELRDEPLEVAAAASAVLGQWYALGDAVLSQLVAAAGPADEVTPPRLWPEHFDIAIELGSEAAGVRANYGFSPGDDDHPEPYAYVGPWSAEVSGELWNAGGFKGAELTYADLLAAADPEALALAFFEARRDALAAWAAGD